MKNQIKLNLGSTKETSKRVKSLVKNLVNSVVSTATFKGIKEDTKVLANRTAKVLMNIANRLAS